MNNFNFYKSSLIVLIIIFNIHFIKCTDNLKMLRDGSMPVFEFPNDIQNVVETDFFLFVAGLNRIYLVKNQYSIAGDYFRKAFFSEPQNQHLSKAYEGQSFYILLSEPLEFKETAHHNNYNRILHLLSDRPYTLLACGTANYGKCLQAILIRSNNLVIKDEFTNDRYDFLASQRSNVFFNLKILPITVPRFLFAHEPDGRNNLLRPPIFSHLILNKTKGEKITFKFNRFEEGSKKASIDIPNQDTLERTKMHFQYGFQHSNYGYVLKTEKLDGQPWLTKLGRVCIHDPSFYSYSEIILTCENSEFTYANAAHIGTADSYLIKRINIEDDNETLFVSFNILKDESEEIKIDNSKGSLICAFSIEQINKHFSDGLDKCYEGSTDPKLKLMNQYSLTYPDQKDCKRIQKSRDIDCYGDPIDKYIEFLKNLDGIVLFNFESEIVTSLATTVITFENKQFNTIVVGTNQGKIHKLSRTFNDDKMRKLHTLKTGCNIINSNPIIFQKNSIIFISGKKLIKYPMDSCTIYSTCEQCISVKDNLKCGWCSIENENAGGCLNQNECEALGEEEKFKTKFLENNCN